MRRISTILLMLSLVLLGGCADNTNEIALADFSAETEEVLQIFDNRLNFYDVNLSNFSGYLVEFWTCDEENWELNSNSRCDDLSKIERIAFYAPKMAEKCMFYALEPDGYTAAGFNLPEDLLRANNTNSSQLAERQEIVADQPLTLWVMYTADNHEFAGNLADFKRIKAQTGAAVTITFFE